ncbi:MAG: hypothetical protein U9N63_07440 [Pseudomonadota bacterium]|nr:hypothetical protein [Pseudomonadota bacterium]
MIKNAQNNELDMALSQTEIFKAQLFKVPRQPLNSAYLLFAEALLPMIARYLQRQQIRFKVSAPLNRPKEGQKRLIFFGPDLEENKKTLPRFVLSYLQELPHCRLFYRLCSVTDTNHKNPKESAGFLVEYGFQHPLPASEISNNLQAETLYITFGDRQRPALIIDPAPALKNDCDLSKPVSGIEKPPISFDSDETAAQTLRLQVKLCLIDNPHAPAPAQALYFASQELKWLETLLQHLPGPLLAGLRWAGDREHGILLLPEDETTSLFPFAEPLKKVKNNLFLPLGQSLRPQLTDPQLDNALALVPEKLTFLTQNLRFDIAKKDFRPLDKMITASIALSTTLKFSDPDVPFDFVWQNRDLSKKDKQSVAVSDKNSDTPDKTAPLTITRREDHNKQNRTSPSKQANAPTETLKKYALLLRRQNDFLGAATCFSLAEEPLPAAECYRLAALTLE